MFRDIKDEYKVKEVRVSGTNVYWIYLNKKNYTEHMHSCKTTSKQNGNTFSHDLHICFCNMIRESEKPNARLRHEITQLTMQKFCKQLFHSEVRTNFVYYNFLLGAFPRLCQWDLPVLSLLVATELWRSSTLGMSLLGILHGSLGLNCSIT